MKSWKPLPEGTRVKHRIEGYEGWIDYPLTECHDGKKVNPDGKTLYRIRVHAQKGRKLAAQHELDDCKDTERLFRSTGALLQKIINKASSDDKRARDRLIQWNELLPLPCTIWALREYDPSNGGDPIKLFTDAERSDGSARYAVERFFPKLEEILAGWAPIAIVPSHRAGEYNAGLLGLVRKLEEKGHVDASTTLVRHLSIGSSRYSSERGVDRCDILCHLQSIKVNDSSAITQKVVLLLDDVVTSGTTFMACRKLLLDAGAAEVICLALGKTKPRKSMRTSKVLKPFRIELNKL